MTKQLGVNFWCKKFKKIIINILKYSNMFNFIENVRLLEGILRENLIKKLSFVLISYTNKSTLPLVLWALP